MNLQFRNPSAIKRLGAFYTPQATAQLLVNWAIRNGKDRFLEPSVGAGSLLFAGVARCKALDTSDADFVAVDVDRETVGILRKKLRSDAEVHCGDFLSMRTTAFKPFDAVISNPPFTRNHALSKRRRASLRKRFEIEGAAGLWVHFILHSMTFLKRGGRLASIVPASAGFTRYGQSLLHRLCSEFQSVRLLHFPSKVDWDQQPDERGAVVLADGYRAGKCANYEVGILEGRRDEEDDGLVETFNFLMSQSTSLGEIASLRIGAVTGNNRAFLLSEPERTELRLPKTWVRPIVSRARHVFSTAVSKQDLLELASRGELTWLLYPKTLAGKQNPARQRLSKIDSKTRSMTVWFSKRRPWWKVDVGPPCDAVFTYMNNVGPRLAFVERGVHCTNTLHKVFFKKSTSQKVRLCAILSLYSSFGQLAAERLGRAYGGGVLKFELKDARSLPILVPSCRITRGTLKKIDVCLKARDLTAATRLADEALLKPILGKSWRRIASRLVAAVERSRRSRRERARSKA